MRESMVVSADGTALAARCSGKGSPLVLVHGAMGDLNSFALIEGPLAEHHTVWVYSRRGRGGSGDGPHRSWDGDREGPHYALEREVEDVLSVLDAAGDEAHLVGHSSGAFYALLAATRAPLLRSLVLYEPPLHVDRADARPFAELDAAVARNDPDHALEVFFPVADITAQEMELVRSQTPIWEALRAGVRVFPREHRALRDEGPRLLAATEPPDVPTLYLHGELTTAPVYPSVDEVARRFPKAQLHCLAGQRHLAPMFDPTGFAAAVLAFTTARD